jgi:hypothetical protein
VKSEKKQFVSQLLLSGSYCGHCRSRLPVAISKFEQQGRKPTFKKQTAILDAEIKIRWPQAQIASFESKAAVEDLQADRTRQCICSSTKLWGRLPDGIFAVIEARRQECSVVQAHNHRNGVRTLRRMATEESQWLWSTGIIEITYKANGLSGNKDGVSPPSE